MKKLILLPAMLVLLAAAVCAQTGEWKTETSKDGQVTVQSNVSRRTNAGGKEEQLVQYIATATADVSVWQCIALLQDVSMHKDFNDDSESRIVKTISDNEWIVYYYCKVPWPFKDFDMVYRMKCTEDNPAGTAIFSLNAEPESYEKGKVDRISFSAIQYEFKAIDNNKTAIKVTAATCPTTIVADWMVKQSFPSGPAQMILDMIKLAKTKKGA